MALLRSCAGVSLAIRCGCGCGCCCCHGDVDLIRLRWASLLRGAVVICWWICGEANGPSIGDALTCRLTDGASVSDHPLWNVFLQSKTLTSAAVAK